MHLIRYFEEEIAAAYSEGLIGGFCHLCIGQEAIYAGIKAHLTGDDLTITSYRDHGLMLAVGSEVWSVASELFGRESGCSKGKGGSMHMFDPERGFFGGHGIVGAQTSIGTGLAFAKKYKNEPGVVYVFLGDGAANQGQFYESMNMAALWNLPVVYIIENNQYAMGTSVERASCTEDLFIRASGFGIKGCSVDGMNLLSVIKDSSLLIKTCRAGEGPVVIEMKAYRYKGHSMSDPAKYRTRDEVKRYKQEMDPINSLESFMISERIISESEIKDIIQKVKTNVDEAISFSKNSAFPSGSELFTDVLS